ncbi:polyketide cyclase [Billgrantia pellis]|uniref:Polyketide cyclase n=1 Tax=Billgrantia pellis TaxID=2606936 RepID=A0A7V7FYW0_9GAMM|nr:SRPBCC family protein [Halomonas pellis]KAA0011827.1 polyketide cyclase [Halomonas pellis]
MTAFRLDTRWLLEAPTEVVFGALADSLRWPEWWHGLTEVCQHRAGDEYGIGRTQRFVWRSPLGYRLCFDIRIVRVERPCLIEGVASGDVAGIGRWQLREEGSSTCVHYHWQVHTVSPWMSLVSRMARPLIVWNHRILMRRGAKGLARYLDCPLIDHRHERESRFREET